jgi:hypothetical protein
MLNAINKSDYIITLGWRGAEKHFTSLLTSNGKNIKRIFVVSPTASTNLSDMFSLHLIDKTELSFTNFIRGDPLEDVLKILH